MPQPRRHKSYVVVDDPTWLAFKAACITQGLTIEGALGALVRNVVGKRVPMEQLPLAGPQAAPRKAAAPSKTKPKKRTAGERFGTNKRSGRPTPPAES